MIRAQPVLSLLFEILPAIFQFVFAQFGLPRVRYQRGSESLHQLLFLRITFLGGLFPARRLSLRECSSLLV